MTATRPATSARHVEVRSGAYADSVTLLQVSRDVGTLDGVESVMVAMGTPLNVDLLQSMGFDVPAVSSHDMVVAVRVGSNADVADALAAVDAALAAASRVRDAGAAQEASPRTIGSALRRGGSLALVSVPGPSAFVEAMDAVESGRHVMVFSDNVSVPDEVFLKRAGADAGVLVMGPDCGTAVVGGVGLGFANVVAPGPVGIVAASGTGCQQLLCLLDSAGVGVSAALGVGGRDVSEEVGGLATEQALRMLDEDPATQLVVLVSKPPAPRVTDRLTELIRGLATPVQLALLGDGRPDLTMAAETALTTLSRTVPEWPRWGELPAGTREGFLRGLFCGGTLCDEAMLLATASLGPVRSNIPLGPDLALDRSLTAPAHLMIDFGDDALTAGRPHPMIDQTLRLEHLRAQAADPRTGVLLLDVVLGHGADADPAAQLAPAIAAARDRRDDLPVVVTLVGTAADPQGLESQASRLADAGAAVFASNAMATRAAISLLVPGSAR